MPQITIPHNYSPRPYQMNLFNCLGKGFKRGIGIWHRRAGKDKTLINVVAKESQKRVGSYYYFFPEYAQARKAIWNGMDKDGFPYLGHFPEEIIAKKRDDEMMLRLKNGSIFQLIGTDKIDSIMSTNPVGCVFSEYSLQRPEAWEFIRPILRENGGWALFNYTPRGHNHGHALFQMALKNPAWFCEILTIRETGVLTEEDIQAERDAGMAESLIQQEFYCGFEVTGEDILVPLSLVMDAKGRTVGYPNSSNVMGVDVGMSLGGDPSAIVIRQGGKIHTIKEFRLAETLEIAGRVREAYNECSPKPEAIFVDSIGWGAGVAHVLSGWGLPTVCVNVAESASSSDKFNRRRDELWWKTREVFAAKTCAIVEGLEHADKLISEISTPTYGYLPNGKIKVEGKAELKKRGVPSPNIADAFVLTMAHADQHTLAGDYAYYYSEDHASKPSRLL